MFTRLFLLFTLVPAIELALLIELGQILGAVPTVALILFTGAVGAALARSQGFAVLQRIQVEAAKGFPSGDRLVEGLLIVVGGVLLVTPGVITDGLGLALIAPPTRRWLAPRLKTWFLARAQVVKITPSSQGAEQSPSSPVVDEVQPFEHPLA